jgi:hypothetical protein
VIDLVPGSYQFAFRLTFVGIGLYKKQKRVVTRQVAGLAGVAEHTREEKSRLANSALLTALVLFGPGGSQLS